ncbi:armadillo-type protein [Umbelopsis sp. PMI_123]|nr:armadillo-type protein [Umbelopsis sp. PMI_123]
MDVAQVHAHFVEACSDLQVPATRAAADEVLTNFRQTPQILPACQYILDHTDAPMVQFQAAAAICEIVLREFSAYQTQDLVSLKNFILNYCLHRPNLQKYVRDQLLLAVATIMKRGFMEWTETDREGMFSNIKELWEVNNEHAPVLASALSIAYIDRFSDMKTRGVGLNWEFHQKCKVWFEHHMLQRLFQHSLQTLHHHCNGNEYVAIALSTPAILVETVALVEKILHWEFDETSDHTALPGTSGVQGDNNDHDGDEPDARRSFTIFPQCWRNLIGNQSVIWLFFTLYLVVQHDDRLAHRLRQCLIQLSGQNEKFFEHKHEAIVEYANAMILGLQKCLNSISATTTDAQSIEEQGPQILGVIQVARRLIENLPVLLLSQQGDFYLLLNDIAKLTSICLRGTVEDVDQGWISEAFDECLATWVSLVVNLQSLEESSRNGNNEIERQEIEKLSQFIKTFSFTIVQNFIDTRIEMASSTTQDDDEEVDGGMKDRELYADQLISIATLARLDPSQGLHQLQYFATEQFNILKDLFATGNYEMERQIGIANERIHWIMLISGSVMADAGEGEKPLIPNSLMHLSGMQSLAEDQVVNLSNTFLEMLQYLSGWGTSTIQATFCSPQVAESLIWYMERWSKSYLLIDEEDYGYVSPNIARMFGKPGPSEGEGQRIVNFLIDQIKTNFGLWNADDDVLIQIIRWLNTCGMSRNLKHGFLRADNFPGFIEFITQNLEHLPEVVHSPLIKTIVGISSGSPERQLRDKYLTLIFSMIEKRMTTILHAPTFTQDYQNGIVIDSVQNVLEMFGGLAQACDIFNTTIIFEFCSQFFNSFLQLMNLYKNVPEVQLLILQFFADISRYADFESLGNNRKESMYNVIIEIFKVYGTSNTGKSRILAQEEEADQPYADTVTALNILSNIMTSEFESFNKTGGTTVVQGSSDVADVVFFGINLLIPNINMEMLKIPNLCQQYIKLISNLIEFFPDKLNAIPAGLFNNLMTSLEYGIGHDITDVNILSFQAIAPLALWAYTQELQQVPIDFLKPSLEKFLHLNLELLLFKDFDPRLLDASAASLLPLIYSCRESYLAAINQIIHQQPSDIQERLISAFHKLDAVIPPHLSDPSTSSHSHAFSETLLVLLREVRGVIRVK